MRAAGRRLPLVLAGGKGWLMDDFAKGQNTAGAVVAGYVADRELEWLYRNCFGFVYPSLFEGFGMPVLEAMALGAPVICSRTTSLPEVAGEAASAGGSAGQHRDGGRYGPPGFRGGRAGGAARRGIAPGAAVFLGGSARKLLEVYENAPVKERRFERAAAYR